MTQTLQEKIGDIFDIKPASRDKANNVIFNLMNLIHDLNDIEIRIMNWHRNGRPEAEFDALRQEAWSFEEIGKDNYRRRLFAGFVTAEGEMDGFEADFVFDCGIESGLSEDSIYQIMKDGHSL